MMEGIPSNDPEGRWSGIGRRVARNTGWQLAGEMVGRLSAFALFAVLAREVSLEGFGDFTFAISLAILLTLLGGLSTDHIVTRAVAHDESAQDSILSQAITLKLWGGSVALALAVVIATLGEFDGTTSLVIVLIAMAASLDLFADTVFAVFQGRNDFAPQAIGRTLQGVTRATAGSVVLLSGGGLLGVAIVYVASAALTLVLVASWARSRLQPRLHYPSARSVVDLARASLPIALGDLIEVGTVSLLTVLLLVLDGNAAVGILGAATRIVTTIYALSLAFGAAIAPLLARADTPGLPSLRDAYESAAKTLVVVLLPLSAGLMLFAEPAARSVFGNDFGVAGSALMLLAPTVVLHGFSQLAFYTLIARNRQHVLAGISGVVAVATLGLAMLLIPKYSYDGVAAAILMGALAYALLATRLALRLTSGMSVGRVMLSPAIGVLAMGAFIGVGGRTVAALAVSATVYVAVVLAAERRWYPDDLRAALRLLRLR